MTMLFQEHHHQQHQQQHNDNCHQRQLRQLRKVEQNKYISKFAMIVSIGTCILIGIVIVATTTTTNIPQQHDPLQLEQYKYRGRKHQQQQRQNLVRQQPSSLDTTTATTTTTKRRIQENDYYSTVESEMATTTVLTEEEDYITTTTIIFNTKGNNRTEYKYSNYSCIYIYDITPNPGTDQCTFAKTCNGGEGIWASFVFCLSSNKQQQDSSSATNNTRTIIACVLLSPIAIVWMVLLFRMLGSTAEDYFSPALEMLSTKCKLPPRFAGVTLLALGNGAADVSATIAAITNDPDQGYLLSLGALTGAAMFISTVISAAVVFASIPESILTTPPPTTTTTGTGPNATVPVPVPVTIISGFRCRGAFIRDVIALSITVITVYYHLSWRGIVDPASITSFLTLYGVFVGTVLIADIYHRSIVIPRIQHNLALQELNRQILHDEQFRSTININTNPLATEQVQTIGNGTTARNTTTTIASNMLSALSNYEGTSATRLDVTATTASTAAVLPAVENVSQIGGGGIESDLLAPIVERPIVLHGANGLLQRHGQGHGRHPLGGGGEDNDNDNDDNNEQGGGVYTILNDSEMQNNNTNSLGIHTQTMNTLLSNHNQYNHYNSIPADNWYEALEDGYNELGTHFYTIWYDIIDCDELNIVQKFLLICELPATIARQCTVPIPCDGFYVRSITSVSLVLSPLWFVLYLYRSHDVIIFGTTSNNNTDRIVIYCIVQLFMIIISLGVLRYGPPTHVEGLCPMPLWISVPISVYGFIMAATWIDTIADSLVSLLNFVGIICHIPGPIIGLTLLAWGNSMGDLSANITMARKGLANMAMTACFAGPVFNILVGLGFGFASLSTKTGIVQHPVTLTPSIRTGFIFLLANGICVLYAGLIYGKGIIPYQYGYVSLLIYTVYVITSISLQYNQDVHIQE